jgi:hypothetical protein
MSGIYGSGMAYAPEAVSRILVFNGFFAYAFIR